MVAKIEKKIVGYRVATQAEQVAEPQAAALPERDIMHEGIARPEVLLGATYKIKTPDSEHAIYVTINDMFLNYGTEFEERRPYEIFVNSKNMSSFPWITALTRVASAVFRKGGDIAFLVDELKAVFDPGGGYWKKGGVFMPSIVAEIGYVLERHLISIGMLTRESLSDHAKAILAEKREQFESQQGTAIASEFPEHAQLCTKCSVKAAIIMDGCLTCLNCGDSKCG